MSEREPLLGKFPYDLVMKVESSEPRDVLQSERTALAFIRFSTTLFFTALAMMLNFRINSSGKPAGDPGIPTFSHWASEIVSYILLGLAVVTLLLGGVNYFHTLRRYAKHKILTTGPNNVSTAICFSAVVLALVAICVLFIIEGYISKS